MELTAIIQGLEAAPKGQQTVVHTGSMHVFNAMTKGEDRNANQDLWERVDRRQALGGVQWRWVRQGRREPGKDIAERVAKMEAGLFQARNRPNPARPGAAPGPQGKRSQDRRPAAAKRGPKPASRPRRSTR